MIIGLLEKGYLSLELIMDLATGCTSLKLTFQFFYYCVVEIKALKSGTSSRLNDSGLTSTNVKMPTSRSYHSYLIESLRDPQEAAAYLDAVLEDGSFEEIRSALTDVAAAQISGLDDPQLASHQSAIYETLSQQNQLDLSTLLTILSELGFRMSIAPRESAA